MVWYSYLLKNFPQIILNVMEKKKILSRGSMRKQKILRRDGKNTKKIFMTQITMMV